MIFNIEKYMIICLNNEKYMFFNIEKNITLCLRIYDYIIICVLYFEKIYDYIFFQSFNIPIAKDMIDIDRQLIPNLYSTM